MRNGSEISPRVQSFFTHLIIAGITFSLLTATDFNSSNIVWTWSLFRDDLRLAE